MSGGDHIAVTLRLTQAEADALYFWVQGDEAPEYWTCPLDPVGRAVTRWYREGSPDGWANREGPEATVLAPETETAEEAGS